MENRKGVLLLIGAEGFRNRSGTAMSKIACFRGREMQIYYCSPGLVLALAAAAE